MNVQDKKELAKSRNVLIQSNDPSFNYAFLKGQDIEDFHTLPEIIGMNQYDYSFKRDDGDENKLPNLTPASLLMMSNNLQNTEEWYRQKHPNLPEEYYGVMARYSTGQLLTKKEAKNAIKKSKKKNQKPPVGLTMATGKYELAFD
jgi:hypothetical protein